MLIVIWPKAFYWLPFCYLLHKPKISIPASLLGFFLVWYHRPIRIWPQHPITAIVTQAAPNLHKHIQLTVDSGEQPFVSGDRLLVKTNLDFYQQQAECLLRCQPLAQPSYAASARHLVGNCQIIKHKILGADTSTRTLCSQHIPNNLDNSAVLKALLLGQANLIATSKKQLFKYAGLAHLIAVSGLHIGIIAQVFGSIFGRLWLLLNHWCWRIPKVNFMCIGSSLGATFYAFLSGFGDASSRALAMVLVANLCQQLRFKISTCNILYVAMLIILCLRPLSVFSLGFWLSVLAVWALAHARNNLLSAQFNVLGIMLPIQAYLNWPIGWWMPCANFLAIPLFSVIIVPCAFAIWSLDLLAPEVAKYLWHYLDLLLTWFFQVLAWCQQQFGAGYILPFTTHWQILLLACFVVLAIRKQYLAGIGFLALLLCFGRKPIAAGDFQVEVFDVGQGLSILIQTKHHSLLLDTADKYKAISVVWPALQARGLNKLDRILISHGDSDHSGGLDFLAKHLTYKALLAGEPERLHVASEYCGRRAWLWDGVVFSTYNFRNTKQHNDASIILQVQGLTKSALFPGDISSLGEHMLLTSVPENSLRSDFLVAAHHGSISSSSSEFIKAVAPKQIIISAGNYEQYKHPAKAHLKNWQAQHIQVVNTHQVGNIVF